MFCSLNHDLMHCMREKVASFEQNEADIHVQCTCTCIYRTEPYNDARMLHYIHVHVHVCVYAGVFRGASPPENGLAPLSFSQV